MDLPSSRTVSSLVRVGDKEVLVTTIEEYAAGTDCGVPVHVTVIGPNGLATQGKPAEAWQEMLELLGVRKPALSDRHSALSEEEQPRKAL